MTRGQIISRVRSIAALFAAAIGCVGARPADANTITIWSNNGATIPGVSDTANVSASFSFSGSGLHLDITNSGNSTAGNGSVLTGVLFDTDATGVITLHPVASAPTTWNGGSSFSSNLNYTGAWNGGSGITVSGHTYKYGVSATAAGSLFTNSFSLGSNQDDYGIIGTQTCNVPVSCTTTANKTPFAVGTVSMDLANIIGTTITAATFLFTSSGASVLGATTVTTITVVPEPAAFAIFLAALLGLSAARLARRA
jgi:hypothetical protein